MIQWYIICFFFLIKFNSINCIKSQCNYTIINSDNSSSICSGDECYQYIDIYSIIVKPNTCKTSLLILSFSSYKKFLLFRDKFDWNLGDLFSFRQINNEIRQFILFLDQLDYDDKPFDRDQLIKLGMNIDLYTIYIKNIQNKNYLYGSIHYDLNYPQWNIIKIKFRCLKLSAFDKYPCSSEIISPSKFAPQRTTHTFQSTTQIYSSTEELLIKLNQENNKSIDLILIILFPLFIILITIIIFIFVYKYIVGKCFCKKNLSVTPKSSSLANTSNNLNTGERIFSPSLSGSATIPENTFNCNQIQNPIKYTDRHHCTNIHVRNDRNNNYEHMNFDEISISGQQHFVPISSSLKF
ncbi:unnamed protein product [Adineta steineri]|uniref:Uncharacterized protein n=1 Tax=Adineta steineri TaxID=433720 RepID=A0A819EY44_9BILA|nr:unnamed protein product [Adineta steineri]CAF3858173.1 unnamed protein product [Adineta steineri]